MSYSLIDSGEGQKFERFGDVTLVRPCAQAVWWRQQPEVWEGATATFSRDGGLQWSRPPGEWEAECGGIQFKLKGTDFGHVGLFPEQAPLWQWIREQVAPGMRVLNLFAYSGGASVAAAQGGAEVWHVDAAKGMVEWARENGRLNGVEGIRWLVDDARKFLKRAVRRGQRFEGVILDPPSFGRGKTGEVFKIEEDMAPLLDLCVEVLSEEAQFVLLSSHTPGYTPIVLQQLLQERLEGGTFEGGEMVLEGPFLVPSGAYGRWTR